MITEAVTERLVAVDSTPVGDEILDPALAAIAAGPTHDARHWISVLVGEAELIRQRVLDRLGERKADRIHASLRQLLAILEVDRSER